MTEYGQVVEKCRKYEFLIVVGAEDHYSTPGNKMMFLAQAVRYVRQYASKFDLTTVHYYTGDATAPQTAAFETAVTNYGGTVKCVSDWTATAARINTKQVIVDEQVFDKRISVLMCIAHGVPGRIWLANRQGIYFTKDSCAGMEASAFAAAGENGKGYASVHITSWACQTGNGNPLGSDASTRMANSLAQSAANIARVTVFASATRTSYAETWETGLSGRIKDANGSRVIIDGAVWQSTGADGHIKSLENSYAGDIKLPHGMHVFTPGQADGYAKKTLY